MTKQTNRGGACTLANTSMTVNRMGLPTEDFGNDFRFRGEYHRGSCSDIFSGDGVSPHLRDQAARRPVEGDNIQFAKDAIVAINAHDVNSYLKRVDEFYVGESEAVPGSIHGHVGLANAHNHVPGVS